YPLLRRTRGTHHKIIGRIMAEHLALDRPVIDLFRTWKDPLFQKILEAQGTMIVAFLSCHTVQRIIAFISFVAGKYVQICAVQPDPVIFQIFKISFYIVWGLGSAKIGLGASRPPLMPWNCSVRQTAGKIFIKAGG